MTEAELHKLFEELRNLPAETECLEFKEAKNTYDLNKLGKYFSALSNEANLKGKKHAWLIFGINDKSRDIVNTQYRTQRKDLDSLKSEIANKTTNRITFNEIYELSFSEGRVIMFEIPAAPKGIPTSWEGHYYGRDGEDLGPLNDVEYETIRNQSNNTDWSANIVDGATIKDLDEKAILKAREEYKKKSPTKANDCDSWDDETFLNKIKITIQGKITNAAIILLGKDESEHFIKPALAKMSWILKDEHGIEKDYEHFGPPFILNTENLFNKIRNLTYRYISDNSLFPTEIKAYEPYVIREALHNCIAHQDYSLGGIIRVVEKTDELVFTNVGSFMPGSVEKVIEQDAPQERYRNSFLANAMVNLNMIDIIGSGIKKMFIEQRNRFFPLPDYDLSESNKVIVKIAGRIWDENYTRMLMNKTQLDLKTVVLLDKVQKSLPITDKEAQSLKNQQLIEGRKPNFHVSSVIADKAGQKADYIKNKAFDNAYYRDMILEYLKKFKNANRQDIDNLLINKLPSVLSEEQKKNKVKNALQFLKDKNFIELDENQNWKIKPVKK
ncbi:MAG: putative DNA binding domain-containing protein [Bacteroidia bacterium]|nr:putative DNA binding domain-containing protein [Bacteroidia bacterium]